MDNQSRTLLDQAIGLNFDEDQKDVSSPRNGQVILVEDCVETSGAFLIHHLLKRALSPRSSSLVIFLAFAQPFSHYDRILRKMGCNLSAQRDNKKFIFFDLLMFQCPAGGAKFNEDGVLELYGKIQKAIEMNVSTNGKRTITVMIDDVCLMEVAANGSTDCVLDFLHYCHTLTVEFGCHLALLTHKDIYSDVERPTFILQMKYLADVVIKTEPLATGLATDVHGQLTVLNKDKGSGSMKQGISYFHYRVKENCIECSYPGTMTC
ncbi:elongator complex protein 6 [Impatiens glandulifera]|uniref:elongator complex protein 6 n=1 Tax=Impatiens glandulifera TaxID=253017 RepID=UPI001FB12C85|nr:elongator complex protein 6 [Impatiens glandulifera]